MVFSVGNPEAEIMLVGEAPGYQEEREREPFVGRYIDQAPAGSAVLIMASNPMWGWPAVEHRHRVWASRYGALWMLPAFGRARTDHTETPALLALEQTVRQEKDRKSVV